MSISLGDGARFKIGGFFGKVALGGAGIFLAAGILRTAVVEAGEAIGAIPEDDQETLLDTFVHSNVENAKLIKDGAVWLWDATKDEPKAP